MDCIPLLLLRLVLLLLWECRGLGEDCRGVVVATVLPKAAVGRVPLLCCCLRDEYIGDPVGDATV